MNFFKKLREEKPLAAIVVDILHIGEVQKTFAEDDAEQIKKANQTFIDALLVDWEADQEHTQSAFILDDALREINHPSRHAGGANNRRISLQMSDDSDGEVLPDIELPPDFDPNDPVLLEAILAQRQWERQQLRISREMNNPDENDEDDDYDFDSEYDSNEDDEEVSERDYQSHDDEDDEDNASRSYVDDDASRSASVQDEDYDENYSTYDEGEESSFNQALSEAASDDEGGLETDDYNLGSGLEEEYTSQSGTEDDQSYNDDDENNRAEAPEDHFSDEFSETNNTEQQRPIDVGVREERKKAPEDDDHHVSNNDDDHDLDDPDARDYSAHAERYHEDDNRYDESDDNDVDCDSFADRSQSENSGSYRDDASTHDEKLFVSSDDCDDDDYSAKDSKLPAVEDGDNDDQSEYSHNQSSVDSRASHHSEPEKDPDGSSGYRSSSQVAARRPPDYSDDACLHQREEEEELEIETLEEARRNLGVGEKMHPFLLEHYMALKERKEARRRLSQLRLSQKQQQEQLVE